uniref:Phosphatidylinositol 4-phosphate 5-kinase-like protein 1-like n=1 Tax=Saccoglossus kowalevskii TaxID=10224 RepID=A0ABM0LZ54_SACKO|nr:PREDICTED: phosphatidylinositol 4-phosphate 5-kinase-like protein 1-like [Saccoglossus kowalevskii]
MVKILGLHYIKIEGHKGKYFTVMQSVFYPDERILERYDLKGCEASRYTEPEPENSEIITVLKDKNLKGYQIDLGEQRQWFLDQVQYDTEFLEQIGVMDYSLLLGYHPIHFTERQQENQFAHVVVRVQKSVPLKRSEATIAKMLCDKCKEMRKDEKNKGRETSDEITGNELKDETTHDQTPTESPKTTAGNKFKQASKDAVMLPNMVPTTPEIARLHENRESTVELDQLKQKNMRLLLEKTNALNIIDGKNDRYFMGIIDFFTEYKAKKKAEHIYKSIRYPTSSFSTVSPSKYARRFRKFMEDNSK